MNTLSASRAPLPGLAKLYLGWLYAVALLLVSRTVSLGYFLAGGRSPEAGEHAAFLCMLVAAGLVLRNITAIHARSHTAPRVSRFVIVLYAVTACISSISLLRQGLDHIPLFGGEYAKLWTWQTQGLVPAAAWFLYWKRSPKARAAFGLFAPQEPGRAAPSLELMRVAGAYILVTGFCYSLTFVIFHFGYLLTPAAYPGHWLIFGLSLTLLLLDPARATQKTFDRLGWLFILWMAVLAGLSLAPLLFPLLPDLAALRLYHPGAGLPLHAEAVLVIAMFWYVARQSVAPEAGKTSAFWVRGARAARAAGVRGLDLLYVPLLLFVMGNIRPAYGPQAAYGVDMVLPGLGLIGALGVLLARPAFFVAYMRCFSVAAPAAYVVQRLAGGLDGYGLTTSLLYAVDWSNATCMLLGAAYFGLRDRLTDHPALVIMRFTAWGCIALSCVMLIHAPSFFDMADDVSREFWWVANVGFPWMYLPFAAGLLYAGRGRSVWEDAPPPALFTASVLGLIAALCMEKLLATLVCALQRLPLERALAVALNEYDRTFPPELGTACALAVCLWALGVSGEKREKDS